MFRTALVVACATVAAYFSAAWLTHDFQVWTAEGARRLEVALQPIAAPPVTIDGPGVAAQPLAQWLADGRSVTVIDFVYTRCQTTCLAMGGVFQQMQSNLQAGTPARAGFDGLRLLSISFDGQHDSPQVLQRYAERLHADPGRWHFVRVPSPEDTRRLLADFQVVVVPDGRGDYEHNAALLVVDQRGRLVRVFDVTHHELALAYARHLVQTNTP